MMTLRESINHVMDRGAQAHIGSCIYNAYYRHRAGTFPEVMSSYGGVMRELRELPKRTDLDHHIILKSAVSDTTNEECVDVHLLDTAENQSYSLDFVDWGEIIDLVIEDRMGLNIADTVAHILWEITFWGMNTDDIESEKNKTLATLETSEPTEEISNIDDLLDID
jgi:hypothetical protein